MKGKTFTADDLSEKARANMSAEEIEEWCAANTERYKIVATDESEREDRQALIAEELIPRAIAKLSSKARRVAGQLRRLTPQVRAEVLAAFDAEGNLRLPFKMEEQT